MRLEPASYLAQIQILAHENRVRQHICWRHKHQEAAIQSRADTRMERSGRREGGRIGGARDGETRTDRQRQQTRERMRNIERQQGGERE